MTAKIKLLLFSVTVFMAVIIFFSIPINLGIFTAGADAYAQGGSPTGEPSLHAVVSLVGTYIAVKKMKK
ncbi:MAG: hypothetical protein ACLP9S_16770 [Syntrophales bacterium]